MAPLLFDAGGGLAGPLADHLLNAADSILGDRVPERKWLGKAPARSNDAAIPVPSRLTAMRFVLVVPSVGGSPARPAQPGSGRAMLAGPPARTRGTR